MLTTSPSLLNRVRQPADRDSWERFINLYTPLLYAWAHKANVADPADLVQQVFLVLFQKLPGFQYDPTKSFRSWLKTVLLNLVRKEIARKVFQPLPTELPGPEQDDTCEEDRQRLVARALQLMQRDFQPAVWKSFWEHVVNGRAAKEVSKELGIKASAVYVYSSRVMKRLQQEFAGLLD